MIAQPPAVPRPGWGTSDLAMGIIRRVHDFVANVLVPPTCPTCRRLVAVAGALCGDCWREVEQIDHPVCDRLALPLAWGGEGPLVSTLAAAAPPAWDRARAAVVYGTTARRLVFLLKYHDRLETAGLMGRMMARAGADLLEGDPLVVPVPLHPRRLVRRRTNQSALLAREAIAAHVRARAFAVAARRAQAAAEARLAAATRPDPDAAWLPPAVAQAGHARLPHEDAEVARRRQPRSADGTDRADDAADDAARAERTVAGRLPFAARPTETANGSNGPVAAGPVAAGPVAARPDEAGESTGAPGSGQGPHGTGGPAFAPEAVARVRRTRSQVGLSPQERAVNVRGAFAVRRPEAVRGRRIVLVDDVLTTGATLAALSTILKRAGAASVDVLVFARVAGEPVDPA